MNTQKNINNFNKKNKTEININKLEDNLLTWYDAHQRALPWRAVPGYSPNPYHVWLSEIMLQQTTVATVKDYFSRFVTRWPVVEENAGAELFLVDVRGGTAVVGFRLGFGAATGRLGLYSRVELLTAGTSRDASRRSFFTRDATSSDAVLSVACVEASDTSSDSTGRCRSRASFVEMPGCERAVGAMCSSPPCTVQVDMGFVFSGGCGGFVFGGG